MSLANHHCNDTITMGVALQKLSNPFLLLKVIVKIPLVRPFRILFALLTTLKSCFYYIIKSWSLFDLSRKDHYFILVLMLCLLLTNPHGVVHNPVSFSSEKYIFMIFGVVRNAMSFLSWPHVITSLLA